MINTRPVPAIVMLTAGFVTCLINIYMQTAFGTFVKTELLVLIGFYLLGCMAKLALDKGFSIMEDRRSGFDGLEIEEDLIDDLAMADDQNNYDDDYQDNNF